MSNGPTPKQQKVVDVLAEYVSGATVRQLVDRLDHPVAGGERWTRSMVYAALRALINTYGMVDVQRRRENGVRVNVYSLVPGT